MLNGRHLRSLSMIEIVILSGLRIVTCGSDVLITTWKVSVPSTVVSSRIGMVTFLSDSPGPNCKVELTVV